MGKNEKKLSWHDIYVFSTLLIAVQVSIVN